MYVPFDPVLMSQIGEQFLSSLSLWSSSDEGKETLGPFQYNDVVLQV